MSELRLVACHPRPWRSRDYRSFPTPSPEMKRSLCLPAPSNPAWYGVGGEASPGWGVALVLRSPVQEETLPHSDDGEKETERSSQSSQNNREPIDKGGAQTGAPRGRGVREMC